MKNSLLTLFFALFTNAIVGQINEIGFFLGGTNYIGDVGRTNYIYPNKPAGALIYKWNWNPRIALRATYSYLPITADDKNAETDIKINRGLTFSNTIHELAVGMEFNFFEYDLSSGNKNSTPYILVELAAFNYKSAQAEIAPSQYLYTNKTSYALPIGVGYKSKLSGSIAFALETKIRYTFVDDLDYSTDKIPSLNFGKDGSDWYVFTGVSLVYTFGRPSCYSPR